MAQRRNSAYEDYINRYKDIAIEQMMKHRIPASITLAQGLLESGAGKSLLTVSSNNHFGIKCHNEWTGRRFYKDDDIKDDCLGFMTMPERALRTIAGFCSVRDISRSSA